MGFKVSEEAEKGRIQVRGYPSYRGMQAGMFKFLYMGRELGAMAVNGDMTGWEHVSVSLKNRTPNWGEMCFIKDLFWDESDCVVQFHPAKEDYVNIGEYVLHLWRSTEKSFPMPPKICV